MGNYIVYYDHKLDWFGIKFRDGNSNLWTNASTNLFISFGKRHYILEKTFLKMIISVI